MMKMKTKEKTSKQKKVNGKKNKEVYGRKTNKRNNT